MKKQMLKTVLLMVLLLPAVYVYTDEHEHISPFDGKGITEEEMLTSSKIFQENEKKGSIINNSSESFAKNLGASGPGDRPDIGDGIGQEGVKPALSIITGEYFLLMLAVVYFIHRFSRFLFYRKNSKNIRTELSTNLSIEY